MGNVDCSRCIEVFIRINKRFETNVLDDEVRLAGVGSIKAGRPEISQLNAIPVLAAPNFDWFGCDEEIAGFDIDIDDASVPSDSYNASFVPTGSTNSSCNPTHVGFGPVDH